MARRKSRKSGTRDGLPSLTVRLRSRPKITPSSRHLANLHLVQDLRTFDFEPGLRPARLFSGSVASVGLDQAQPKTKKGRARVPYQIAFTAPGETLVCVRRGRRREVLFAKKKTGKGGQRRPRRNQWSSYKC